MSSCLSAAHRRSFYTLAWLGAALIGVTIGPGCSHPSAQRRPQLPTPEARSAPANDAAASGLALGRVVSVGPTGLQLPVLLHAVSPEDRSFAVAAARALRLVYEEDIDDASQLEALLHRLQNTQTPLDSRVAEAFTPALQRGIARANRLQACAPGLRALKDAYRAVYIEAGTQTLRRLDSQACLLALQLMQPVAQHDPTWVITIEPMGPKTIADLLAPCRP